MDTQTGAIRVLPPGGDPRPTEVAITKAEKKRLAKYPARSRPAQLKRIRGRARVKREAARQRARGSAG